MLGAMKQTYHEITLGDSRSLPIDAQSVSLVVTSPPYPMIEMWDDTFASLNASIRTRLAQGDSYGAFELMHQELDSVWKEVQRIVVPGGMVCINVGDATRSLGGRFRKYPNAERITGTFRGLGFDVFPRIIWRKTTNAPTKFMGSGMLPAGAYVTLEHEYILLFRQGGSRDFTAPDLRRDRHESAFFWEERNQWFSDVWVGLNGTAQQSARTPQRRSGAYPLSSWVVVAS